MGLVKKSNLTEHLARENETYRVEYQRVAELETRLNYLQQFEQQIRRVLGTEFSSNPIDDPVTVAAFINADTLAGRISSDRYGYKGRTAAIQTVSPSSASIDIYKGLEIPSMWPVEGFISRGFEWNPVAPTRSHTGVDIAGKEGAVVRAAAGGIVIWTGWSARFGNLVVLAHQSGYFSFYGHNQVILVSQRQHVDRGMPLALLGNTGYSSAPHLHFEIWLKDQPVDPFDLLPID